MIKVFAIYKNRVIEGELLGLTNKYGLIDLEELGQWRIPKDYISTTKEALERKVNKSTIEAIADGTLDVDSIIECESPEGKSYRFKIIKVNRTKCVCEDLIRKKTYNVPKTMLCQGKRVN